MLRVARSSATVRFDHALTADGRTYEDELVDLAALQPHPTRGAAAGQDGARSGAARLAKQPKPSSSSASSSAAAAADAAADAADSDDEQPAKVAKQQRRQQAAVGQGVGSARDRGGGVSSPAVTAAATAAVATPPTAAGLCGANGCPLSLGHRGVCAIAQLEASGRTPRRKRGRREAEGGAAKGGGGRGEEEEAEELPKRAKGSTVATAPPKFTPGLRGTAGHAATAARGTPTVRPTAPHGRKTVSKLGGMRDASPASYTAPSPLAAGGGASAAAAADAAASGRL